MINRYFYFNILRKTYLFSRKQIKKILGLTDDPHDIALGTSIGIFVAFTPTIPMQMLLSFFLAWCFKANKTAAIVPAWVTNPVTAPPIFFLEYLTGCLLLGNKAISKERFMEYVNRVMDLSVFHPIVLIKQLESLLIDTWNELGYALLFGSLIWAIPLGALVYPITKKAVIKYRERKMKKKDRWKLKDENLNSPTSH